MNGQPTVFPGLGENSKRSFLLTSGAKGLTKAEAKQKKKLLAMKLLKKFVNNKMRENLNQIKANSLVY
jgi:hypothetical protein